MSITAYQMAPFTAAEAEAAFAWGFNCGPAALAAVLELSIDAVRPHLGDFEARGYMNPTMMAAALASLRVPYWRAAPGAALRNGLVRIQWGGPWMRPEVPPQARYAHTHWIATRRTEAGHLVFDVNALERGGWIPFAEWRDEIVPRLVASAPRRDGNWEPTHRWELAAASGNVRR